MKNKEDVAYALELPLAGILACGTLLLSAELAIRTTDYLLPTSDGSIEAICALLVTLIVAPRLHERLFRALLRNVR